MTSASRFRWGDFRNQMKSIRRRWMNEWMICITSVWWREKRLAEKKSFQWLWVVTRCMSQHKSHSSSKMTFGLQINLYLYAQRDLQGDQTWKIPRRLRIHLGHKTFIADGWEGMTSNGLFLIESLKRIRKIVMRAFQSQWSFVGTFFCYDCALNI